MNQTISTTNQTISTTLADPTTGEDRARETIEQAVIDHPYCDACGAPTVPVAQGDEIWLACSVAEAPKPILRRILTLEPLVGHTRHLMLDDLTERLAA